MQLSTLRANEDSACSALSFGEQANRMGITVTQAPGKRIRELMGSIAFDDDSGHPAGFLVIKDRSVHN